MKKVLVTAMVLGMLAMAGAAWAAPPFDTTVTVTANVQGTCRFTSSGSVSFVLDPATGGVVNGIVSNPTFWCTKGLDYTITDDSGMNETGPGARRMKHTDAAITEYIPYSFDYTTSASGTGNGANFPITMDIIASVAEANYMDATAGDYSDTVTLTVNP